VKHSHSIKRQRKARKRRIKIAQEKLVERQRRIEQPPQPRLAQWHRSRLKHDIVLLSPEQRAIVEEECQKHCDHRGWRLWEVNARTNHVHAVVTAIGTSGKTVRDQLKANCTRVLREHWSVFQDRPVWTRGGDWECVNNEDELEAVCEYVRDAQDRMHRGK
jgi:REP element-mobilizing transposase RayT